MVSFGIIFTPEMPIQECVKYAKLAEDAGIEYVWIADESPSAPFRDVFVVLSAIAHATEKVKIGTAVCNPYTRHPAILAFSIATIDELSKGRAILGIGAGGSLTLRPLGIPMWNRPLTAIREAVSIIRKLFDGEAFTFEGKVIKVYGVKLFKKLERKIPIYMAARGDGMLRLLGELADGALLSSPIPHINYELERIEEGCKKAGRSLNEVEIGNAAPFSVSMNGEKAKEAVKSHCTFMISDFPLKALESVGIGKKEQETVREAFKKGGIEGAKKLITLEMVDALTISGTPEECIAKFKAQIDAGINQIIFSSPYGPSIEEAFRLIKEEIIPKLK
ncbi:MAG: 5,10-methylenetetrahydromethanopterin reductase [Candidatus Bathyarchaeia archaeon]